MHGSGDNQPNVQKSKIQSYSVEHCTFFEHLELLFVVFSQLDTHELSASSVKHSALCALMQQLVQNMASFRKLC